MAKNGGADMAKKICKVRVIPKSNYLTTNDIETALNEAYILDGLVLNYMVKTDPDYVVLYLKQPKIEPKVEAKKNA